MWAGRETLDRDTASALTQLARGVGRPDLAQQLHQTLPRQLQGGTRRAVSRDVTSRTWGLIDKALEGGDAAQMVKDLKGAGEALEVQIVYPLLDLLLERRCERVTQAYPSGVRSFPARALTLLLHHASSSPRGVIYKEG